MLVRDALQTLMAEKTVGTLSKSNCDLSKLKYYLWVDLSKADFDLFQIDLSKSGFEAGGKNRKRLESRYLRQSASEILTLCRMDCRGILTLALSEGQRLILLKTVSGS